MGRTVKQIKAAMTPNDRAEVEARTSELIAEVEGLKAFRVLAERSQEQIAESLGIKQPSVHREADRPVSVDPEAVR